MLFWVVIVFLALFIAWLFNQIPFLVLVFAAGIFLVVAMVRRFLLPQHFQPVLQEQEEDEQDPTQGQ